MEFFNIERDSIYDTWQDLPKFSQEILAYTTTLIHFKTEEEFNRFKKRLARFHDIKITDATKSIWFPKREKRKLIDLRWVNTSRPELTELKYPLYIVSKGRWESRLSIKALELIKIPYKIIIEKQEYPQYSKVISPKNILILPKKYKEEYDTFDDLGLSKSTGPGPARNFAWDHSISGGHAKHWVLDDNILEFYRMINRIRIRVSDGTLFRALEDYCDRYENIALAGPNYTMFGGGGAVDAIGHPVFIFNTRIYSILFVNNAIPYRWRGRYNEDTDISLRALKDGWCTISSNVLLANKVRTQTLKGGNTEEFYKYEGTYNKSKMQVDMHPDCSSLNWRFGRWHHFVDYSRFKKTKLILKKWIKIKKGINEYGLELINQKTGEKIKWNDLN